MQRALFASVVVAVVALCCACSGASSPPPDPGPESTGSSGGAEPASVRLRFSEGGPLVRMGRVVIPAGDVLLVEPGPAEEAFVFVEDGELEGHPLGTALRIRDAYQVAAVRETALVGALVQASEADLQTSAPLGVSAVPVEDSPVLLNAGDKLRVQIFHDAASGASFGAFSLLDADAGLSVPEHVHETSAEVLYILSGDGTMILGEERFSIAPGQVIYVPANTNHGYEAGSQVLRALQIYAPPGPEQRFRGTPPTP